MIEAQGVTLRFGGRPLYQNVNIKFTAGNCYGLIGANGTGKSTFLRILSGELEPNKGEVLITPGERLGVLRQDHFAFDEYSVMDTVFMGYKHLYEVMKEKETLYNKADFTDADGVRLGDLEAEFAEMDGWNAESDAQIMLSGLGVEEEFQQMQMSQLDSTRKVKVLLAQALFGKPDILLLDEPTNHLDLKATEWLENFLLDFDNTVIVVSHDRYFLNKVCTHIVDIDFSKITMYVGNYDFWYQYTQMAARQMKEQNKKTEQKIKELQEFIQRFSANASKSKQATSRKKLLDNLQMENFVPSSRRYPFISFQPSREAGNDILAVSHISKTIDGKKVLNDVSFTLTRDDKVALLSDSEAAKTALVEILTGNMEPDEGSFKWGITITTDYFPKDNGKFFDGLTMNLIEWLRQYSTDPYETTIRGWLGRMLFSGEEALKEVKVLSGGERVRCMLCKMMLSGANFLLFDEPTNHLDLESITSLDEGLTSFKGGMILVSHDHQIMQNACNRVIELLPNGIIDRRDSFDEYLNSESVAEQRASLR